MRQTRRGKKATQPARAVTRAEMSAVRRGAILDAALAEFSARGFAAARLDDVARRAHVAKGTIYLHFRSKESLFQELVRSVLTPVVGKVEQALAADLPLAISADAIVELFLREVIASPRRDVMRLIISEGPRFPKLAEFYYREVLSRILKAARARLKRAAARGEVSEAVARFPQLLGAPAVVAVVWGGLFERFEPLDVRGMMQAYFAALLGERRRA